MISQAAIESLNVDLDAAQDEVARIGHESDGYLNAFMRFCIDKLGHPEPTEFSYSDGFQFIKGKIAELNDPFRQRAEEAEAKLAEAEQWANRFAANWQPQFQAENAALRERIAKAVEMMEGYTVIEARRVIDALTGEEQS